MLRDGHGLTLTTTRKKAVVALEAATASLLGHRADMGGHLATALIADSGLVVAHVLAGFGARIQARAALDMTATRHLAAARAALLVRGGTARERMLVAALAAWHEHADMPGAAAHLRHIVQTNPHDLLAIKLEHALRFMLGDAAGMRHALEEVAPAWTRDMAGHGFLLGLRAFAMEETGEAALAEHLGRAALAAEPNDLWAGHAVAHVLETDGRAREGLEWIDAMDAPIAAGGAFGRHLMWHAALFHLHLGQCDGALALLDSHIDAGPAWDVRDFANTASLLWRLEAQGLKVGPARWDALAAVAESRLADGGMAFFDLHEVLALGSAGRRDSQRAKLRSMAERSTEVGEPQAEVLADCALPVAEALAMAQAGAPGAAADILLSLRSGLRALGGSNAQRDLFERILIQCCLDAGREGLAAALLEERAARRTPGAWEARCAALLDGGAGAAFPPSPQRGAGGVMTVVK